MAQPAQIEIRLRQGAWRMTRDGGEMRAFGHADEAVHEAVRFARELIHTGQPAQVRLHADGRTIDVDISEPERVAAPGDDEKAAITPDRSRSG